MSLNLHENSTLHKKPKSIYKAPSLSTLHDLLVMFGGINHKESDQEICLNDLERYVFLIF